MQGEVLDATNGRPLVGVLVTLHDLWKVTRTDDLGYFRFEDIPAGDHELGVYGLGYFTLEQYIPFLPNEVLAINLDVAPIEIEGIEVAVLSNSVEEYRSFGTRYDFIGPEIIEEYRRRYGYIADMLRARFPGIRVRDNSNASGQGMSGLCVISTRSSTSTYRESIEGCAVILVDGLEMDRMTALGLHVEEVATIRYITRVEARLVYGELGKYGMLLIETVDGRR